MKVVIGLILLMSTVLNAQAAGHSGAKSNPSNAIQTNGGPAATQSFLFSINLINVDGNCGVKWSIDPNFPLDKIWYRVYPKHGQKISTTGPLSVEKHKGESLSGLPQEYGPGAKATLFMLMYDAHGNRSEIMLLETPRVK
jgi:hypothetical protein